jgi:hypothetical protein
VKPRSEHHRRSATLLRILAALLAVAGVFLCTDSNFFNHFTLPPTKGATDSGLWYQGQVSVDAAPALQFHLAINLEGIYTLPANTTFSKPIYN